MTQGEFAAAVEKYGDMVYRVAFSALRHREDAEDVTQETLLKLYREDRDLTPDHLRFWLIHVALNECRRARRWYRRVTPLEELPQATEAQPEDRELLEAVMALPEKLRVAVYLHYYEGYTTREIGALTGAREATVRTRLLRARERLREYLNTIL